MLIPFLNILFFLTGSCYGCHADPVFQRLPDLLLIKKECLTNAKSYHCEHLSSIIACKESPDGAVGPFWNLFYHISKALEYEHDASEIIEEKARVLKYVLRECPHNTENLNDDK
jgi:hypothetical protein